MLALRNPHSVLATFAHRPEAVREVQLPGGRPPAGGGAWERVVEQAQSHGVRITEADLGTRGGGTRGGGARGSGGREQGGRERGAEALVEEREPVALDALFAASAPEGRHRLWLALDQVQDPHNVGAVFRTAAFYGVAGVLMTEDRASSLTPVVYDVASGGLEAVPFAIETNLRRALGAARDAGAWVLGTTEHGGRAIDEVPRDRDWLLVVGNEERGLRRLTLESCDEVAQIVPQGNAVTSLNVSVATGIALAALSRPA